MKAKQIQDASDQLDVKASADQDGGLGATEVDGAREHALIPETEDARACAFAPEERGDTFFGDFFKAPGKTDEREESPDETRNDGQEQALREGESFVPRPQRRELRHPI